MTLSGHNTLVDRIELWAAAAHGWDVRFGVAGRRVTFRCGPITGYGDTTNEAVNNCADGLIEEGWPDDRGASDGENVA